MGGGVSITHHEAGLTRARRRIDDLDEQLISLLRERKRISAGIQRDRLASGGVRTDIAREREIFRRYGGVFGSAGTALSSAVLEICRGRLGSERDPVDEDAAAGSPRIGVFSFLNCGPLRWALREDCAGGVRETETGTPERLATALLAGEVDVAPISLLEYLRHADELLALPGLAIGSDGPVMSCQLFSRAPLDTLDGRTVALGASSRTATLLARILLEERFGITPDYRVEAPVLADMLREADAAVLIGDAALAETLHPRPGLLVHDLGELWRDWTGLPMVFAVWAVRRSFADGHADEVRAAHAALLAASRHGSDNTGAVAEALTDNGIFPKAALRRYFDTLDYTLGEHQLAGLRHFAKLAARRGEVPDGADITLLDLEGEA